jgi:hypothetical protein
MNSPHTVPGARGSEPAGSDRLVMLAFARLDGTALGVAVGTLGAFVLFTATIILVVKGGPTVGPTLALLGQYFPGYSVTWGGSLLGLAYGFVFGFVVGWLLASLRNLFVFIYLRSVKFKTDMSSLNDFLDQP